MLWCCAAVIPSPHFTMNRKEGTTPLKAAGDLLLKLKSKEKEVE